MFWLWMAVWLNGQSPKDYKLIAKVGPFQTEEECWSAGAVSANAIQSKDDISNALGLCAAELPPAEHYAQFLAMKSLWEMVCASLGKEFNCSWKGGHFVDPWTGKPEKAQ